MTSTPGEIEADVRKYSPWIRRAANNYCSLYEYDDIVSEGLLTMWQARQKWHEGLGVKMTTYMFNQVKWRWLNIHKTGLTTGYPDRHSKLGTAKDKFNNESSYDFTWEADGGISPFAHPMAKDEFVDLTFHYDEIHQAVEDLPMRQRQYVIARFWLDLQKAERLELLGLPHGPLWGKAKATLQEKLAHLEEMAT